MITLDKSELRTIRKDVCSVFLDAVKISSRLNTRAGSNKDMNEELELMYYLEVLSDFTLPPREYYFNNQYAHTVSTLDLGKIHNRALEIRSSLKTRY